MFFKIKLIPKSDDLKIKDGSAIIKFLIDEEKLENNFDSFFSLFNEPVTRKQKLIFLKKEETELIKYSNSSNEYIFCVKKVKINEEFSVDFFRNYFAGLVQSLHKKEIENIHIIVPAFKSFAKYFVTPEYFIQSMGEGVLLGNYNFDEYKTDKKSASLLNIHFHYSNQKELKVGLNSAEKIIDAVFFSRNLTNEPAATLTPDEFAKRTKNTLIKDGVKVTVWNKKELQKRKMKAILAVGLASKNEPKMIILNYKPKGKAVKKVALVGKGVCYDSGGLSIKPTAGMLEMKADMAGGALVVGVVKAAALLQLPIEIIGIIPAVENMINGNSYKPGDVIGSASGKTIEVKDTDAEGRIILADALHYASQQKPDEIIDFATLTGAIAVALGLFTAGLFTKNDTLADKLISSSKITHEKIWRMPFDDEFKTQLKSDIADVSNLGTRWGGAITAGKFLEYFVEPKIPWAHLDIAGPALKHDFTNYTKNWDTGFGVRLMISYLMQ
jgi:leucyl aminopeptidase